MTAWTESQVITKLSPRPVAATVSRLTGILAARGMKVFAVIDQAEQASEAGLKLRETVLVIFGSPVAGTPVMVAAPLAALGPHPGRTTFYVRKALLRAASPDPVPRAQRLSSPCLNSSRRFGAED